VDRRLLFQKIAQQTFQRVAAICQARQVALAQERCVEAGHGDNDLCGGDLDQVGPTAGSHNQEESVRHEGGQSGITAQGLRDK